MRKGLLIILMLLLPISLVGCRFENKIDKAYILVQEEKYDEAIILYQNMIDKEPKDDEAYLELADVYELKGEIALQEEVLKDGMDQARDLSLLQKVLAKYYMIHGREEEAYNLLVEILEHSGKNRFAYESLLDIYHDKGENDQFIKLYETFGDDIKNEYADALAVFKYAVMGEAAKADKIVQEIDIENIKDHRVFEPLARYFYQINDREKIMEVSARGIKESEDRGIFRGLLYAFENEGDVLVSFNQEDANGDGRKENILLVVDESGWAKLTIQDETGYHIYSETLVPTYEYEIDVADLNEDGTAEILLKAYRRITEAEGFYYYFRVDSFKDNEITYLMDGLKNDLRFDKGEQDLWDVNIIYIEELERYGLQESYVQVDSLAQKNVIADVKIDYVLENDNWVVVNTIVD